MITKVGIEQLQQRIDYKFRDPELLQLALSHRSCGAKNNERLEFLGDSILGDTVEALIGAIYLDSNLDESRRCVLNWFKDLLSIADEAKPTKDAKTTLQEFLQQRGHALPQYRVIETGGEAHSRLFTVSCKIDLLDREFTATASSRRKAEQMVAEKFLATLEIEH